MSRQEVMEIFVGLGSNQGRVEDNLAAAVRELSELDGVKGSRISSLYYTEPQGVKDQPWFGNQVVRLECDSRLWSPQALLDRLLGIEAEMGRVRCRPWGERIIDLDLLFFGQRELASKELVLPHPRIRERAFVLVPLLEIAPDKRMPDGKRLADCLERLSYRVRGNTICQADSRR